MQTWSRQCAAACMRDSRAWRCAAPQLDELTQTARQAVTVALRALAQLRKAAQDAARDRDRLGTQGRLIMRRAAVQARTLSTVALL